MLYYCLIGGNDRDVYHHPHKFQGSVPLYIKLSETVDEGAQGSGSLDIYRGSLNFKSLGFPLKYVYYIATILMPTPLEFRFGNRPTLLTSISTSMSSKQQVHFKFEDTNVLKIFKITKGGGKISHKIIFSNSELSLAKNCEEAKSSSAFNINVGSSMSIRGMF